MRERERGREGNLTSFLHLLLNLSRYDQWWGVFVFVFKPAYRYYRCFPNFPFDVSVVGNVFMWILLSVVKTCISGIPSIHGVPDIPGILVSQVSLVSLVSLYPYYDSLVSTVVCLNAYCLHGLKWQH